jgi:hypothetical protein
MTSHPPILAFPIGTLTNQGIFIGMQGKLARFEKNVGTRTTSVICSPKIAQVITQEQENERLASEDTCRARGFWGNATVLRGDAAHAALSAIA